jgi:hypothetical protein
MIAVTLNAIFGAGLFFFALNAVQRGWPYLRDGWMAVQTQASQPGFRQNVERRRLIAEGGRFLIGGIGWLGAGIGAFVASAYFSWQALRLIYGWG